jgi:hypothetical protein
LVDDPPDEHVVVVVVTPVDGNDDKSFSSGLEEEVGRRSRLFVASLKVGGLNTFPPDLETRWR